MPTVIEIGPYHSIDPNNWGENYSERRSLGRIESEIAESRFRSFTFSFETHLMRTRKLFQDASQLRILDSGCGEGSSVFGFVQLGRKLGIPIAITAITMDPRHKSMLIRHADEVVIGTTEHFFEIKERRNYYHFILDYQGALGSDNADKIIPIYGRILVSGGSALLTWPYLDQTRKFPFEENGLVLECGGKGRGHFLKS